MKKEIILKDFTEKEYHFHVKKKEELYLFVNLPSATSLFFDFSLDESSFIQVIFHDEFKNCELKTQVKLLGEQGKIELLGSYHLKENQTFKYKSEVHHLAPRTFASQFFKGLLEDESRGFFTGAIYVHKDSQEIESYQMNQALLTSSQAYHLSQPELFIHANDVKCSHGSTTGFIGEDELFYLQSRGLSKEKAQEMLQKAYLKELKEKVICENHRSLL